MSRKLIKLALLIKKSLNHECFHGLGIELLMYVDSQKKMWQMEEKVMVDFWGQSYVIRRFQALVFAKLCSLSLVLNCGCKLSLLDFVNNIMPCA